MSKIGIMQKKVVFVLEMTILDLCVILVVLKMTLEFNQYTQTLLDFFLHKM